MARKNNPSKRDLILQSAIHVFSEKSYEKTRVSDIARHAGIAYGLVYHYFPNKEEILKRIFREKWALFAQVLRQIDIERKPLREKLYDIVHFLLQGYRLSPELMRLLMLEINRRVQLFDPESVTGFQEILQILQEMLDKAKSQGEVRSSLDTRLAAYFFFGGLEAVILAYAFNLLETGGEEEFARVSREIALSYWEGWKE